MSTRDEVISDSITRSIDNADPQWRRMYEVLAWVLLTKQRYVEGGEFKKFCLRRGLWQPDTHNRWVGMPAHLHHLGWIEPIGKLEPTTSHSHIGALTFWRSRLFDEEKALHAELSSGPDDGQPQQQDRPDTSIDD